MPFDFLLETMLVIHFYEKIMFYYIDSNFVEQMKNIYVKILSSSRAGIYSLKMSFAVSVCISLHSNNPFSSLVDKHKSHFSSMSINHFLT